MTTTSTLESLLVQGQLLSPIQLSIARRDADIRRRSLLSTIVDLGLITEDRLSQWVSEKSGLRLVYTLPEEVASELIEKIPHRIARKQCVLPIRADGDELTVALADPFDRTVIDGLHMSTGMKIRPVVARPSDLERLLNRHYPDQPFESESDRSDSLGSSTQILTPRPAAEPVTQLDRIEAQIASLTSLVDALERKIASLDATLSRLLPR
jgi:type IV pilus assembly protein PilB